VLLSGLFAAAVALTAWTNIEGAAGMTLQRRPA
jgi:hypothetical protein